MGFVKRQNRENHFRFQSFTLLEKLSSYWIVRKVSCNFLGHNHPQKIIDMVIQWASTQSKVYESLMILVEQAEKVDFHLE